MTTTIKNLHMYRNLIRASKLFFMQSRKERCVSSFFTKTIQQKYRENKNVTDKRKLVDLEIEADKVYSNFKDILENKYLTKYPCSINIVPDYVEKSKVLLSTKSQAKMKSKKWGLFDRLKVIFTNEEK
ncbi:hypothetical protein DICPUDRAFT_87725 [Dictyostelium purpureum]|uniref:Uncharacterized protein n=1 Tax=Dictyostelium purpureum TaxID=5786 RepID=F0ZJZ5_DICPU|nr:uncharacterized protein DICPUDRAFT_87725 [Dictyostelium purpureum]EGC35732.1 hypothetical protein DICPUDRAFT_87725 [Dictyostelium purpureum]|eukprot:XP_003287735.1 hypothetical protein DICPUDRAFT_87725 [Dictyostelium purpureum]